MATPLRRGTLIVVVNLALLALLVGALELGARFLFPREIESVFNDPEHFVRGRSYIIPHPVRGFALRPAHQSGSHRINAAGFRGSELPADLDSRTVVVALGESTTFGWRVDDDETFPEQLNRILAKRAGPEACWVVNAGTPSYTSPQVRLYLDEILDDMDPDVILVSVFWNDLIYACMEPWLPDILIWQQPSPVKQALLRYSGLFRAIVLRPSSETGTATEPNEEALAFYRKNLEAMADACAKRETRLALVLPPFCLDQIPEAGVGVRRGARAPRKLIVTLMQRYIAILGDVSESKDIPLIIHRMADPEHATADRFLDMAHPTALGNKMMAKDLADELERLEWIDSSGL